MFRVYISAEIQFGMRLLLWLRLFLLLLLTFPVYCVRADGIFDFGDLYFETVSDESTPLAVVTAITQDLDGFLWIGSYSGLLRYDGYQFRRFVYSFNDPYSISGNIVTSLAVAVDGKLWVGTQNSGLSVF